MTTLVELYAGSGSLSFHAMTNGSRVPRLFPYVGNKSAYAEQILMVLGAPTFTSYVLNDAEEPGLTLRTLCAQAPEVAKVVRGWTSVGRPLWEVLRSAPVPKDPVERAAVHIALQVSAPLGKPVREREGYWVTAGYAEVTQAGLQRGFAERLLPSALHARIERVASSLARHDVWATVSMAEDVTPFPGAVVYIDPPYPGSNRLYWHRDPTPEKVRRLALYWVDAGSRVAVSWPSPLEIPGFTHTRLIRRTTGPRVGTGRSADREEWLMVS